MIIELHPRGKDAIITCNVSANFALLSAMPARFRWVDRKMVFAPTGAAIEYIMRHWPDAEWRGDAAKLRDDQIALRMQEQNTSADKKAQLEDDSGYVFKTIPFAHQKQAFILSRDLPDFALFHEQGCGKSKVIVDTAAYLWEKDEIDALVVVAPNGVHRNWISNEVPAHLPERISVRSDYYAANRKPTDYTDYFRPSKARRLDVLAFNVDGFTSEKAKTLIGRILKEKRCLLVIDESQHIKNHSAERTKFLLKAGRLAKYRRIMTGTPITRGVENLFSQFKFLNPGILGHESYYTFRSEYCIMGGFQAKQIVGYKETQRLIKIVDGHSHRVLKTDCLDLPPKVYKRHPFELHPSQRRLYDAVRLSALDELTEMLKSSERAEEQVKQLAITRLLRLQQIVCGWEPGAEPKPLEWNPRLDALKGILEDTEGKVIIWSRFVNDIKLIMRELGGEALAYYGEVSDDDRAKAVAAFQTSKELRYLVANRTASAGLTLTAAETAIYYSNEFKLDIRLQSEDRNHRIGTRTDKSVQYIDLEAIKTIDRRIINVLRSRKDVADLILQDPKSLFLEE